MNLHVRVCLFLVACVLSSTVVVVARGEQRTEWTMPEPTAVVVHPLVLLSVVDHYNRVAKDTSKRVVGALLGCVDRNGKIDITESFACTTPHRELAMWVGCVVK